MAAFSFFGNPVDMLPAHAKPFGGGRRRQTGRESGTDGGVKLLAIERGNAGDIVTIPALFMPNFPLQRSESVALDPDFGRDEIKGKGEQVHGLPADQGSRFANRNAGLFCR